MLALCDSYRIKMWYIALLRGIVRTTHQHFEVASYGIKIWFLHCSNKNQKKKVMQETTFVSRTIL
jgi:hypothetical protein